MISWLKGLPDRHPVSEGDLSALVDGRLPEARRLDVDRHVEGCDRCRATLAGLRSLKSMLGALPDAAPPRSFAVSPRQLAGPVIAPARSALLWAPALALSVLVLLLAADLAGGGPSRTSHDSGSSLASQSAAKAEDSLAGAAAAPTPPGPPLPRASGGAAEAPPSATIGADNAGAPVQPTTVAPLQPAAQAAEPQDEGGWPLIRVLEVLSALAFVASLAYVLWYRPRGTGLR